MYRSKITVASVRDILRIGLWALAGLALASTSALAQVDGNIGIPPTLAYSPAPNTPITLSGVTQPGSNGSGSITVTRSGGSGVGLGSTTGLNCLMSGGDAANFSVMPPSQTFTPASAPSTLALSCTAGSAVRMTTLTCTESPGTITGPNRTWPLTCPAGIANIPPNLAYAPVSGQPVVFNSANPIIGTSATAQIRVTPSGGSGSGPNATARVSGCTVNGESVPGTFSGFQGVTLTFVGSTTTFQNLNLSAVIRATPVTGTLQCTETRGTGGNGADGGTIPRSWPLQSAAGRPNITASLSISKTVSAPAVVTGSEFSYSIDVTNSSSSSEPGTAPPALTGIVVLDDIPPALTVISASGAGWNCSVMGNLVDCRRANLAAGASASFDIIVQAPTTPQTVVNSARATSLEVRNPVTSTVSVVVTQDTPPPLPMVDLRIDKRDSADPVLINTPFSYFLDVSNVGSSVASGISVSDTLPAGLTLISAIGPGWTCTGTTTVSCSLAGTLASGAMSSVTLQVRSPAAAGTLSNQARVTSTGNDVNAANDSDTETTVIIADPPPPPLPQADLAITAQAQPSTTVTGQAVELQLTASNRGPDAANAPIVTGTLAQAFDIRSISGDGWACTITGQTIRCTRATLAPNMTTNIRIQTVIRPGSTAAATAGFNITSSTADPVAANNSASVSVGYQSGGADLGIAKSDSVDPVAAAATFFYTLNITNAGPEVATGVRVSDTLPAPLTFVSAMGTGFTCTGAGQTITCNLTGTLAVGSSASVQVNVRAPTTGQSITNEASVGATTTDPNAANNRATQTTRINDRTAQDLAALLDAAAVDPASRAALPVIAAECARLNSPLLTTCREIVRAADAGRTGEVTEALRALSPDEVLAQSLVLREIGATQFFNVDARLNELRRGGGGFSLSGLNVQSGSQSIPLALVGDALQAALGFGESDGFGGLVSPWGFFINGNVTDGQQDLDFARGKVGLDYQSRGLTAGVDYRLNPRFVVGGAVGYANFEADVAAGSQLDTKSLMFTGYGSYYLSDRLYIDTRLTYGSAQLDQERLIHFQLNSRVFDALALGETDATQLTLASSMGYHLNYGAWSVTPSAGLRYTGSDIDAFDETGANEYNVGYSEQSFSSVNFAVGIQFARAVSLSRGVLMPQFDISLNNESGDDPSAEARLISGGVTDLFRLTEESPDSSYGTAGLGFVYLMGNGKQAYVSYRRLFGNDELDRGSLNLGGRFEF